MSSLLTSSEIASFSGIFQDHIDTFSRAFVVYKEPKKTIVNINSQSNYPGYNNSTQLSTNINYTYVSGTFSGMLIYDRDQKQQELTETQNSFSKGRVKLKVKEDAYNYIKNGKTENIQCDGLVFNVISDEAIQNYFGLKYYYFILEQTN